MFLCRVLLTCQSHKNQSENQILSLTKGGHNCAGQCRTSCLCAPRTFSPVPPASGSRCSRLLFHLISSHLIPPPTFTRFSFSLSAVISIAFSLSLLPFSLFRARPCHPLSTVVAHYCCRLTVLCRVSPLSTLVTVSTVLLPSCQILPSCQTHQVS